MSEQVVNSRRQAVAHLDVIVVERTAELANIPMVGDHQVASLILVFFCRALASEDTKCPTLAACSVLPLHTEKSRALVNDHGRCHSAYPHGQGLIERKERDAVDEADKILVDDFC